MPQAGIFQILEGTAVAPCDFSLSVSARRCSPVPSAALLSPRLSLTSIALRAPSLSFHKCPGTQVERVELRGTADISRRPRHFPACRSLRERIRPDGRVRVRRGAGGTGRVLPGLQPADLGSCRSSGKAFTSVRDTNAPALMQRIELP